MGSVQAVLPILDSIIVPIGIVTSIQLESLYSILEFPRFEEKNVSLHVVIFFGMLVAKSA
jgi:hypothetical protein